MGRMSDWSLELEENVGNALEDGANSFESVLAYCKANMKLVDEKHVTELLDQYYSECSITSEQVRELDNVALSEGW